MAKTSDYKDMTADELDAVLIEKNNALAEQRKEILEIQGIYAEKRSVENSLRRLEGMSEAETEALLTYVKAHGVESVTDAKA